MLMVTRVAKTANGLGFGGGKQNTQAVRWVKKRNNIILRIVSYENVAADSLPIHEAVNNSNFEPIIASFAIEAKGKDSLKRTMSKPWGFQTVIKNAIKSQALILSVLISNRLKLTRLILKRVM